MGTKLINKMGTRLISIITKFVLLRVREWTLRIQSKTVLLTTDQISIFFQVANCFLTRIMCSFRIQNSPVLIYKKNFFDRSNPMSVSFTFTRETYFPLSTCISFLLSYFCAVRSSFRHSIQCPRLYKYSRGLQIKSTLLKIK